MIRTFQVLEQSANAIQRHTGPQPAKIVRFDLKALDPGSRAALCEARAQQLVNQRLERLPRAPCFGLQARRDVFIQGQCRSHIVMLGMKHHDVNVQSAGARAAAGIPSASSGRSRQ
jgi:hypothetical protein